MTAQEAPSTALVPPRGYSNISLCGSGATSRVYRAIEDATGRVVALKRLHRQMVRSSEALVRLRRELQSLSALNHPGIVRVHDVIRWGGDPTIVMDFVQGQDLKDRIVHRGPLPVVDVENIARCLLDILATTHVAGIVHRDLKPQNIRITEDGGVFLLDFGTARLCAASELTATGTTVGTPEYMAPELFAGSVYDPRVDIYGLGATLHECLTGKPPQVADSLANLAYLRTQIDIPSITIARPDTPPGLALLVDRCLRRAPEERFASASLAVWSLDHPHETQAFMARKDSHPLCLHCGAAIPADSALCSHCRSDHPFVYAPGPAHVVLSRVSQPAGFVEWLVSHFTGRFSMDMLLALSQRCAALSHGRQRFLSFIDVAEAQHVVAELHAVGVGADVKLKGGTPVPWVATLLLCLLAVAMGSVLGLVLLGIVWVILHYIRTLWMVWIARHGMLSAVTGGRLIWPALTSTSTAAAFLFALAVLSPGPSNAFQWLTLLGFVFLSAVGWLGQFHGDPHGAACSPEPDILAQLRQAVSLRSNKAAVAAEATRRTSKTVYAFFLIVFVSLVPAELWFIASVDNSLTRVHSHLQTRREQAANRSPAAQPGNDSGSQQTAPVRVRKSGGITLAGVANAVLPLTPFAICLIAGVVLLRRRKRIQVDGAALFAELDIGLLAKIAARKEPQQRQMNISLTPADTLIRINGSHAFAQHAIQRAADLARCLPKEAVLKLGQSLETMNRGEGKTEDASLLARCIMEMDPHQKTRFDFLALEGHLEMEAAEQWARHVREGTP